MAHASYDSHQQDSEQAQAASVRRGARGASRRRFGGRLLALLMVAGSLLLVPSGPILAEARLGDPIPTGTSPLTLAANPATNRVYAGNLADDTLTVIDGIANTAARSTIPIGSRPDGIAINPVTNRLYTADFDANTVTVIDGATQQIIGSPITVGSSPEPIAVNPKTNRIYVASLNDLTVPGEGSVNVIDGETNKQIGNRIVVGRSPRGIGVDTALNRVYVSGDSVNGLTVIDGATNTVMGGLIMVGLAPKALVVNSDTHRVYVLSSDDATVTVINSVTNAVVGSPIKVGNFPEGIAINSALNLVYVANTGANSVSVIDAETNKVVGSPITVPFPSIGIDVLPATGEVYASDAVDSKVLRIGVPLAIDGNAATSTDRVTATWSSLFAPNGGDFVGLFEAGAPNTSPLSRLFTNGTPSAGGSGLGDGSVSLPIPPSLIAGHTYETRLVSGRSGGATLAQIQTALIAATNDSYMAGPTGTFNVQAPGVLANDTDPRSSPLKATVVTNPTHGTLSLQPGGAFSYTPIAGFAGTDSFTYRASADADLPSVATVTITVAAVPIGTNDAFSVASGTTLNVPAPGVLANDTDADSPDLRAIVVTNPAHGTLSLHADGGFVYTPTAGFSGTDTFAYRASDQTSLSETVSVTLTVTLDACVPRPRLQTAPAAGGGKLQVHIEATPLNTQQPNRLRTLRFGTFQNAKVTLDGQPILSGQAFTVPENRSTVDFTVERATPGQATTVPLTVVDGCGEWPTFVGGGTSAGF
jgi:YVTN family beta-propeller protein